MKKVCILLLCLCLCACAKEPETVVNEEPVRLTIYYGTIHNTPMMNALVKDYEEQFGVEIQWIPADNGIADLKKMFALEEIPDMFSIGQYDLPAWRDYLYNLSEESWTVDLYEDAYQAASVDGDLVAWPHVMEANGIVYNKKLFRQAGIEKIPETLEELRAVCEKLEQAGIQSFGESWAEFGYLSHMLASPFMYEEDVEAVSEEMISGEKSFADLEYIDEMFDFYDLTLEYGLGEESVANNTLRQYPAFANGEMAMMKQGTWVERNISEIRMDYEIGIFPIPLSENAEENMLHTTTTTFLSVNKDSEHLDETLAFIQWWHENASYYLVEIDGVMPAFACETDTDSLGQLNRDMLSYIEKEDIFDGFGYEYWPNGFNQNMSSTLQSYALHEYTKEETIEQLDRIFRD